MSGTAAVDEATSEPVSACGARRRRDAEGRSFGHRIGTPA